MIVRVIVNFSHLRLVNNCLLMRKTNTNLRLNMKSYRKELWFEVPSRRGFINITPTVEECLRESGVQEGLVLVNTKQI